VQDAGTFCFRHAARLVQKRRLKTQGYIRERLDTPSKAAISNCRDAPRPLRRAATITSGSCSARVDSADRQTSG